MRRICGDVVFPHTNDTPSAATEKGGDAAITLAVAADFWRPVGSIRLGGVAVGATRTAVPEATVDEDNEAHISENEVGLAREGGVVKVPTANASADKMGPQAALRRPVSPRANARHHARADGPVNGIHDVAVPVLDRVVNDRVGDYALVSS